MIAVGPKMSCLLLLLASVFVVLNTKGAQCGEVPVTKLCKTTTTVCVEKSCYEQNKTLPCVNGNCSPEGKCVCTACYTGASCDKFENKHPPEFMKTRDSLILSDSARAGEFVTVLQAYDKDVDETCFHDSSNCPCSKMMFAIEQDDHEGHFAIDADTGVVTLAKDVAGVAGRVFRLLLSVVNVDQNAPGGKETNGPKHFASVTIGIGTQSSDTLNSIWSNDNWEQPHHRQRRAVTSYVGNMTFSMTKTGSLANATTTYVGSGIHFVMKVTFPVGTTDLDVELFTPVNGTTPVYAICNPQITWKGQDLSYSVSSVAPVMSSMSTTNSWQYDWVVFNFGNVTNTGASSNGIQDAQIFIEWDVAMLDTATNNTQYWVSAGAQYNNENEIWIAQAGFTAILDNYYATFITPQFNISGPSMMSMGTTAVFQIDMYLPNPVSDIYFEAFAPINYTDTVSMCSAYISYIGYNYGCAPLMALSDQLYSSPSGITNERVTLNVGHLINTGSRSSTPFNYSVISIGLGVYVPVNATWAGQVLWVGAAVTVGTSQIWAGEMGFVAINATPTDLGSPPTVFQTNTSANGSVYVPMMTVFNMTTMPSSDMPYTLTVTAPVSTFKICQVNVAFLGANVPCVPSMSAPIFTPGSGSTSNNIVTWNLGRLVNMGLRSVSVDPDANVVMFYVYIQPLSTFTTAAITFEVTYGAANTKVLGATLNVVQVSPVVSLTNATSPITSMSYAFGNGILPVNGSSDMRLNIATFPGVAYQPISIEFTVPYANGVNTFSICRVEVASVGVNLPCFNQSAVNASVQYYSLNNYTGPYKATIDIDSICNSSPLIGSSSYVPGVNDSVQFSIVVSAEDVPALAANNTVSWIGSGLSYTSGVIWLGSQSVVTMQTPFYDYYNSTPYMLTKNNWTVTPAGSIITFTMLIKVPPQSMSDWTFIADVGTDTSLSICSVHVLQYGHGIVCPNISTPFRAVERANFGGRSKTWLELYKLTDVGTDPFYYDQVYDNNTLVVEAVVMVSPNAAIGSTHSIIMSVDHGMNGVDNTSTSTFAISPAFPRTFNASAPMPTCFVTQTAINANDTVTGNVYQGETFLLTAYLTIPRPSQNVMTFKLEGPAGSYFDINAMDVVYTGSNLPCISRGMFATNYSSFANSYTIDTASINLGTVCSWNIDPTFPENDQIWIEAVVTPLRNVTLPGAPVFTFTATFTVNDTVLPSVTASMTVTPSLNPSTIELPSLPGLSIADLQLNVSNVSAIQMYPADYYTIWGSAVVPANSSVLCLLDIKMPTDNSSASMTVFSFTIESFGKNLGTFEYNTDFPMITNSTYSSTQMDHAYIYLGMLTNTGHSYRALNYQWGDDNINFKVVFQMSDALVNTANSIHTISFGARLGLPMFYRNVQALTLRSNTEVAKLSLTPTVNSTVNITNGQNIYIDFLLKHMNQSRAEPYNTSIVIYLPAYASFQGLASSNYTGGKVNITNMTTNNGVIVEFDHVYFTDTILFTLQLLIAPSPGGGNDPLLTLAADEMFYNIIYRSGHMNASGTVFQTVLLTFNFTAIPPKSPSGCSASYPLGMQTSAILDCQLTASPSPVPNYQPKNARFGGSTGWISGSRTGPFNRYLQVNFGNLTLVSQIDLAAIAGTPTSPTSTMNVAAVTQYQLLYSNDSVNWIAGENVTITGPSMILQKPMETVYLRLQILAPSGDTAMAGLRVEFQGCTTAALPTSTSDLCKVVQGWQRPEANLAAQFYGRSFIATTTNVYYCDVTPNSNSTSCFMSTTIAGSAWQIMDPRVGSLLGYMPSTKQLFAVDQSQRSYMISEDAGLTWNSLNSKYYNDVQASLTLAKSVPWISDNTNLPATSPTAAYTFTGTPNWGAAFNGLFGGATQQVDWSSSYP